jgi:hypothetical protein
MTIEPVAKAAGVGKPLWRAVQQGLPVDGPAYVGLIGGLIAEQDRHPELIEAFLQYVLLPRRAIVRSIIERGQARGDVRGDIDPDAALELMAGPFVARVFAGLDTGPRWRKAAFETWWEILRESEPNDQVHRPRSEHESSSTPTGSQAASYASPNPS